MKVVPLFCAAPYFSASEVTTLRRYTNTFINIIIISLHFES